MQYNRVKFKRNDYTKKEVGAMPFLVNRLYFEFLNGFQSSDVLLGEAAMKYPEYFDCVPL